MKFSMYKIVSHDANKIVRVMWEVVARAKIVQVIEQGKEIVSTSACCHSPCAHTMGTGCLTGVKQSAGSLRGP